MITRIDGYMEIDHNNGSLFFRSTDPRYSTGPGATYIPLWVRNLPKPIPTDEPLTVTHMHSTSWDRMEHERGKDNPSTVMEGCLVIYHILGIVSFETDTPVCKNPPCYTPIWICSLPTPIPADLALDVIHKVRANWIQK